ncbi:MAG: hypothetical protein QNJ81_11060 [Acidimicrobiia bacterium]|nr:hypothetical protein [Acidimicrobiia bacterium]
MSDSIWEELARSPLDPDPDETSQLPDWLLPVGLAAVLGVLLGLFVLGSNDSATTTTTVALETTTTVPPAPAYPDPIVPAGYVDAAGIGLDAVAAYSRGGNLYIVVNEATRSDQDPPAQAAFHASHWALDGDGTTVEATRTIESSLAPGMKAIEFPGLTSLPAADPSLVVRQASEMVVRTGCQGCGATSVDEATGEVTLDGLDRPYATSESLLIDVGSGVTLSIDRLEFTDEWGYVEWSVIDENEARIRADIRIVFAGTDDPAREGENPTQLVPENLFQSSQQNPTTPNPQPFTRDGWLLLDRVGELISDENSPTSLLLTWAVEWQHPVGEPIVLPLTDLTDLGIVD